MKRVGPRRCLAAARAVRTEITRRRRAPAVELNATTGLKFQKSKELDLGHVDGVRLWSRTCVRRRCGQLTGSCGDAMAGGRATTWPNVRLGRRFGLQRPAMSRPDDRRRWRQRCLAQLRLRFLGTVWNGGSWELWEACGTALWAAVSSLPGTTKCEITRKPLASLRR